MYVACLGDNLSWSITCPCCVTDARQPSTLAWACPAQGIGQSSRMLPHHAPWWHREQHPCIPVTSNQTPLCSSEHPTVDPRPLCIYEHNVSRKFLPHKCYPITRKNTTIHGACKAHLLDKFLRKDLHKLPFVIDFLLGNLQYFECLCDTSVPYSLRCHVKHL